MENKIVTSKSPNVGNVFHPMLFSTLMVQSLLNGTKTQTRRIVKEQYKWDDFRILTNSNGDFLRICEVVHGSHGNTYMESEGKKLPINIGDIIWVRETFFDSEANFVLEAYAPDFIYKADNENFKLNGEQIKWQPSLFMPTKACRLWLKVTNVRVEKLQDITEDDAKNEGISWNKGIIQSGYGYDGSVTHISAKSCYKGLWNKINGKDSWDANPFVWVYDFEVIREAPYGFR